MTATFKIDGRVIEQGTQRGISGLQVELWDKDLLVDDLVGSAATDAQGAFQLEFDESYFQELFLDRVPDIFIKIFKGGELIHSTEGSLTWQLEPGENSITVEVAGQEGADQEALFDLLITRPTDVFSEPDGEIITQLKPGEYVTAMAVEGNGYTVRLANESIGWVKFSDLDDLRRRLDFFTGATKVEPILPSKVLNTIRSRFQQDGGMPRLERTIGQMTLLNGLLDQAQGVLRYDPEAMARFDTMLALLIDHAGPPPRPQNFTLTALRNEAFRAGLDVPRFSPNRNLPCLVNLDAVGLLGSAIFRSAIRSNPNDPAAADGTLWAGLWVMGDLLGSANHLGSLYTSIELGDASFARILEQNMAAVPENMGDVPLPPTIQPTSSHSETPPIGWEPGSGRFPGARSVPAFDCQVEQWERTVRAVRCCGQTYRIHRVTTGGCYGDDVIIEGEGFGDSRLWPFPHTPPGPSEEPDDEWAERDVRISPGPLESVILFPSRVGALVSHRDDLRPNPTNVVAGREYVSWSDTEVVVRLPRGAVSGPVEMRIICDETLRGHLSPDPPDEAERPDRLVTDRERCGLETKLPNHDPRHLDTHVIVQAGVLDVTPGPGLDGSRAAEDGHPIWTVEAHRRFEIRIRAQSAVEVTVTRSDGENVAFDAGVRGEPRTIEGSFFVEERDDQTYQIEMLDACGQALSHTVTVERFLAVYLETPARVVSPSASPVPLTVRISCDPGQLELDSVDVALSSIVSAPGVSLPEARVRIDRGEREATTTINLTPGACARAEIEGMTIGAPPNIDAGRCIST